MGYFRFYRRRHVFHIIGHTLCRYRTVVVNRNSNIVWRWWRTMHDDIMGGCKVCYTRLPFSTGWAKKVIPLVHYITLYERYHFFGPPCRCFLFGEITFWVMVGWLVGWLLTALSTQFMSYRTFKLALYLCRLLRVDLIKPVSNVRPYVRPSTKSFDFNEIWYVGRGR